LRQAKADAFKSIFRNVTSTLDLITHGAFLLSSTHQLYPTMLGPGHSPRRLHVVASSRQVQPTFFLRKHSFAPSLSYLWFSGLQQDGWVAEYVAIALGLVEPGPSESEVRPNRHRHPTVVVG
jgi:hypothetical protein